MAGRMNIDTTQVRRATMVGHFRKTKGLFSSFPNKEEKEEEKGNPTHLSGYLQPPLLGGNGNDWRG